MFPDSTPPPKVQTGIRVLDRAWNGLYRGGAYLLYGRARSGRHQLALQFVRTGVEQDERCLLISPSRPKDLMIHASALGFNLRQAYERGRVKLMRIPPTLDPQTLGDDGLARAMNDLVGLTRQHQPDRLVIDDFTKFVQFQTFERFGGAFLRMLEAFDELDTTLVLGMGEPGNAHSQQILRFMQNQMTGSLHVTTLPGEDSESTQRRLHLMPNIGHLEGEVREVWDLAEILQVPEAPPAAPPAPTFEPPAPAQPPTFEPASFDEAVAPPEPLPEDHGVQATNDFGVPSYEGTAHNEFSAPSHHAPSQHNAQDQPHLDQEVDTQDFDDDAFGTSDFSADEFSDDAFALPPVEGHFADDEIGFQTNEDYGGVEPPAPTYNTDQSPLEPAPDVPETTERNARPALGADPSVFLQNEDAPAASDYSDEMPSADALPPSNGQAFQTNDVEVAEEEDDAFEGFSSEPNPFAFGEDTLDDDPFALPVSSPFDEDESDPFALPADDPFTSSDVFAADDQADLDAFFGEEDEQADEATSFDFDGQADSGFAYDEDYGDSLPSDQVEIEEEPEPEPLGIIAASEPEFALMLEEAFANREEVPFLLIALRQDNTAQPNRFGTIHDILREPLADGSATYADVNRRRMAVLVPGAGEEASQDVFAHLKERLTLIAPDQAETLMKSVAAIVVPDGEPFSSAEEFLDYTFGPE